MAATPSECRIQISEARINFNVIPCKLAPEFCVCINGILLIIHNRHNPSFHESPPRQRRLCQMRTAACSAPRAMYSAIRLLVRNPVLFDKGIGRERPSSSSECGLEPIVKRDNVFRLYISNGPSEFAPQKAIQISVP